MRRKDDEKERCIKEAVIKLILQEGFHGASISKIAKMAGVSPATVYIYFENKENMLQDIYSEYSEEIFDYLLSKVSRCMGGPQLIEVLIRSYYDYILEHKEVFSFVEQFSNCPSLANSCSGKKGICNVHSLIGELKQNRIIKNYNNDNLLAIIFYPVKAIAADTHKSEAERAELLGELVRIIQDAVLL
ncbi:transcriptional regulator, TetR family [Sporobacter termitidis DSM 10068]|uniref:Transcriptional regulator, TetR family n=1 Tax=Sporobacter termitidis DSM 10068 TaxID=1123282 RepID=A0A1M5XW38_9FIRM|nr:TetR/AcrR family transcriptional regulator [Sporobacter termitidis]SHI03473.1 transcriptional regulator, TetR family [Sporobacter termitidis DSM 10068]